MATELPEPAGPGSGPREAAMVALLLGYGCAAILDKLLSFLEGSPARGPALNGAVLVVGLTVVMACYLAVILLYLHVTLASFQLLLLFACALLLFVASLLRLLPRRRRQ